MSAYLCSHSEESTIRGGISNDYIHTYFLPSLLGPSRRFGNNFTVIVYFQVQLLLDVG